MKPSEEIRFVTAAWSRVRFGVELALAVAAENFSVVAPTPEELLAAMQE